MQWICADKRLNNAQQVQFSSKISLWQRRAREDAVDREGKSKWSRPSDCLGAAIQVSDLPNGWLTEAQLLSLSSTEIFSNILEWYRWVTNQYTHHISLVELQSDWMGTLQYFTDRNGVLLFGNSTLFWLHISLGSALMISGPLFQRVGDGHVRLSVPQFAKDAAQTKFANCYWFKQQYCDCRPSKPFPLLVRRGQWCMTSYNVNQQLVAKNPRREEASTPCTVAPFWWFCTGSLERSYCNCSPSREVQIPNS